MSKLTIYSGFAACPLTAGKIKVTSSAKCRKNESVKFQFCFIFFQVTTGRTKAMSMANSQKIETGVKL